MGNQLCVGDAITVANHEGVAYFQGWSERAYVIEPSIMVGGGSGGQIKFPVAIVMYEDGKVGWASVELLKRIDQKEVHHEQSAD